LDALVLVKMRYMAGMLIPTTWKGKDHMLQHDNLHTDGTDGVSGMAGLD